MTKLHVVQENIPKGEEAMVQVLGLLCRLGDEDRLELHGCPDPEAIYRLADYLGARHDAAQPGKVGWSVRLWHARHHSILS